MSKTEDKERKNDHMAHLADRYKDKLTTLPDKKVPLFGSLYMYQGFWYKCNKLQNIFSIESLLLAQETFKAHPADIYVTTFPKSGTTWIKSLVFATVNRTRYKNNTFSTHPLSRSNPHKCVPFIETELYRNTPNYPDEHSPRLLSTHTCYTSLPQTIVDCGCRIVYMCRNPKDVLVYFFHFLSKMRNKYQIPEIKLEDLFETFANGSIMYGPYWDHVKGYYKASIKHPTRILFLTYEDMTRDTANGVKRLAEFLGVPFTKEEEVYGSVDDIVRLCSLENLKDVDKDGLSHGIPNETFYREGKIGDWANHLTSEMIETLDQITKENFLGLNISF
ncbi:flavonol sulfotransferase-like [Rutidosis leptorrhynchoides]|uniref:flavonol sulfotransferase-like n=1 Tax=Rutidosis leptorrhynchoides TaxID=125765 RepID=UPI003A998155